MASRTPDLPPPDLIVRYSDGWWRVVAGGVASGKFPYRVDAEEAAIRLAAERDEAVVAVEHLGGEVQALRCA